ncbi:hypothetical protein [Porphyromonas gingivicanis]|uniref:hypothetical protein n=1 Tax=Porphyromonas gingivicanis TaxID=266762 RepID=UPI000470646F|nr:hypothetical protein [Porphyromonas gingivicanis]
MVITLQISATPELLEALNQLTEALTGKTLGAPAVTAPAKPTSKKSAPAPESPKSEEPAATAPAPAPAPAEAPTIHEPANATASTLTLDDVKRIIMQKNKEGHREEIIAILKGYGFTSVPSITPDKFEEVFSQVSAL